MTYHYFYPVHVKHANSFIIKLYTLKKTFEFGSYITTWMRKGGMKKLLREKVKKKYRYRRNIEMV